MSNHSRHRVHDHTHSHAQLRQCRHCDLRHSRLCPEYTGDTAIAGVPGRASPVLVRFADTAGSATARLLPTGQTCDIIGRIEVT
ncbi:MAG TPA: PrpF domain-containing protein [Streptosporangiaceae bacterium]